MSRETPCDWGPCPYDANSMSCCEYYCGLGVDNDEPDYPEMEEEEYYG